MAMALGRDNGDYLDVSYSLWAAILELAERYGWRPAGTEAPQGTDPLAWDGSYYSSDCQRCQTEGAYALANALDSFLAGAPPYASGPPADVERTRLRAFVNRAAEATGTPLCHPVEDAGGWLDSPEGLAFLDRFVQFCRGGAFELG